ncbi:ribonuclease HII [Aquisalimonas asiatica]|uniref:Ribonuclease HII n=1 Tax=Aquisalimonas asiatica TaxID=406100 RepID=A0A1H8QJM6_9GAMM|nr:ribonuclease HII [Aquisalimonas asiatica]SEO54221.1 RNase HII [Aquisalimonas asiatica]
MNVVTGGAGAPAATADGRLIAGVDEAGRGPLAGPVVVAAVILDQDSPVAGINDSKRLTARRRETLADAIREQSLAWAIVQASPQEIDTHNIFQATLRAMRHAVESLTVAAGHVLVDGKHCPELPCSAEAIVGGDGLEPSIGAASILAKVERDRIMVELEEAWPGYGFARHKGYPTRDHMDALKRLGPTPEHRRSFAPVREALAAPPLPFAD